MRDEAEEHAEEDRMRKENVEARNNADNTAYAAEKALEDLGDKVPAEIKSQVEEKAAEVRAVLDDPEADTEKIKSVTEELSKVIQQIGAAAYEQAGPAAGPGPDVPPADDQPPDDEDEGEVVEGEFHDA
jgi:molecular chaperone DnaK